MPYSSSIRAIRSLSARRQRDVLALGAVAEGRVVEDDGAVGRRGRVLRHGGGDRHAGRRGAAQPRIAIRRRSPRSCPVVPTREPVVGVAGSRHRSAGPEAVVERRADGRLDRRRRVLAPERPAAAASPPTGSSRSGSPGPGRRCPARSRGSARTGRTCRARSGARRARPTAASRGEPASTAASSDRMSPNRFSVTMHVEVGRLLDEQHRARVDELVADLDVRDTRPRPRRRPSARAATSRGRWPCRRSSAGRAGVRASSKASRTTRADLALGVRQRVERGAARPARPVASVRSPK